MIRKKHGAYADNYIITNKTNLIGIAEATAAASEIGAKVDVEADIDVRASESTVRDSLKSRATQTLLTKRLPCS